MRLHRRALMPENGPEAEGGCWFSCSPPPVPSTYDPSFAPSPPPYGSPPTAGPPPCPPQVSIPPAPAPAPTPVNRGRRDQGRGMPGYGAPPGGGGGGGDHHRHLVTSALIAAGVIAFVSLILLGVSVAVRRRQVRRRRQALLAPAAPAGAANDGGGGDDPEAGGGGGVVHHIWYIRTVGLDEAAINSIAVTQYRAGAGLLGAADCSVCLGEFQDGELVRLLPKCGHAFHVPCIDTWLRAHVNCPLCRSDVLDPAAESSGGPSSSTAPADPDANANDAAGQAAVASDASPDQDQEGEEESDGPGASSTEEEEQSSSASPEPLPPPQLFCPLPRIVRRAASMDAALVSTAAHVAALDQLPEEAPEEEQQIGGRRKRGTGQQGGLSTTDRPASVGVPRSFFSRHCRARSSVLPLGLD